MALKLTEIFNFFVNPQRLEGEGVANPSDLARRQNMLQVSIGWGGEMEGIASC